MSKMNKKKALLAASVAGLIAVAGVAVATSAHAEDAAIKCAGANACKGTGACGGKGSACAGNPKKYSTDKGDKDVEDE
jgi:uncharacterized membrane protein